MMLLYAKTILHNLPLVNWHYWVQILSYHKNFWISLVIFQLLSFASKDYVSHRLLMEKRNTVKVACVKQFLHTYLECKDICIIRKTFLSILLNLHISSISCPIYSKYFIGWYWGYYLKQENGKVVEARYPSCHEYQGFLRTLL